MRVGEDGSSEVIVLDGKVVLANPQGEVTLGRNERGVAEHGCPPAKSAVLATVNDLIQWNLYYPAVVNVPEFGLNADEQRVLADSLAAYTGGDLVRAADLYPWERANVSAAESLYRAALLLSVGQVEKANVLLNDRPSSAARAVAQAAVTNAPEFGFAWARLAELDFSFGRRAAASTALERALDLFTKGLERTGARRGGSIGSEG